MSYESAIENADAENALLVELSLPNGAARFHMGVGVLRWGGFEWAGAGRIGSISMISSGSGLDAGVVEFGLGGLPSGVRSDLLNVSARGSPAFIYEGVRSRASGQWLAEPEMSYAGLIDSAPIADGDEEGKVSQTARIISATARARRLTGARRTDAHQQSLFPGDTGFASKADLRQPVQGPSGAVISPVSGGKSTTIRGART